MEARSPMDKFPGMSTSDHSINRLSLQGLDRIAPQANNLRDHLRTCSRAGHQELPVPECTNVANLDETYALCQHVTLVRGRQHPDDGLGPPLTP